MSFSLTLKRSERLRLTRDSSFLKRATLIREASIRRMCSCPEVSYVSAESREESFRAGRSRE
jgi:hypothetical protein